MAAVGCSRRAKKKSPGSERRRGWKSGLRDMGRDERPVPRLAATARYQQAQGTNKSPAHWDVRAGLLSEF